MGRRSLWGGLLAVVLLGAPPAVEAEDAPSSSFGVALESAEQALVAGDLAEAGRQVQRALERDAHSPHAWAMRARWAEAAGDLDERVYALHKQLALGLAQGAPRKAIQALRKQVLAVDPFAKRYLELSATYLDRLMDLAKAYRKARRPHSAIRVYQQALALDPEQKEAQEAIEAISAAPDPSLAETAKPDDLLADVSAEWIRAFDREHATWEGRAKLERENYTTQTDAGYEVLVRSAEAMEQMNAFYRVFFRYGHEGGKQIPRIDLNIFRERDTYLELGIGPPVDWSKGHFTGGAVEAWIGASGFDDMTRTLFHEAAHQFVSLATNAVGWLNEGLACFFEGCQIQANGTVLMNRPAAGRLFALAGRMEAGWMRDAADGIDLADPSKSRPTKAPTFRILIENDYAWGPPWYAPTWGLVFFLYNLQDPQDGRFVYRDAFREYIDTSGGRTGTSAIENFEKIVLGQPKPLTRSLAKAGTQSAALPATVDEVDALWKRWIVALRDEQRGSLEVARPYADWARFAIERKDMEAATEHFERGLRDTPRDVDLLEAFAEHLVEHRKNKDRATRLLHTAIAVLEAAPRVDEKRVAAIEEHLEKIDRKHRSLIRTHRELERSARSVAEQYLAAGLHLMAMHVSAGLGTKLRMPSLLSVFRTAVERSGKSLALWQLAYNEQDLSGWSTRGGKVFEPYGAILRSHFGTYKPDSYGYSFLTVDRVTSGDFSLEAEVRTVKGENAFAGLVFGRKSGQAFHALIYFPEGVVDLTSFYGPGAFKAWRHEDVEPGASEWHRLRVDVIGRHVDVFFDDVEIASQAFPSQDVLRGGFGLITGPGQAQFRQVRYLARDAQDPGAVIERSVRRATQERASRRPLGYHLGFVPPWPTARAWVQEPASAWAEAGYKPTLVVLWSLKQNAIMPLDGWLAHLASTYRDVGLRIVSVCERTEPETLSAYLAEHPFPGSVAIDDFDPKEGGVGKTMDRYAAGRKGYPWVLLLDIDQQVVWEGNPGFTPKNTWKPEVPSYVDAPLAELVERRRLRELPAWLEAWSGQGREALHRGDFEVALPLLEQAKGLPGDVVARVALAATAWDDIRRALEAMETTQAAVRARGADPALAVLLELAERLEIPVQAELRKPMERALKTGPGRAWRLLGKRIDAARKRLVEGRPAAEALAPLLEELGKAEGAVPALLRAHLEAALEAGDAVALQGILEAAHHTPAAWLATEWFRFPDAR